MNNQLQNEKSSTIIKFIISILVLGLLLFGIPWFFTNYLGEEEFSEEEIASATAIAQSELNLAYSATETHTFDNRIEGIQSVGYIEPTIENSTMVFEKTDSETGNYILLKLRPHDNYENLTRILIQIFDKDNRKLITEQENVLTWQTEIPSE